jgi:aminopeptidase N
LTLLFVAFLSFQKKKKTTIFFLPHRCFVFNHKKSLTHPSSTIAISPVVPSHYAVTLEPDLQAFTFKGHESIDVEVKNADLLQLTLHCADIAIDQASVRIGEVLCTNINYDKTAETATLTFASPMKVSERG